MPVFAAVLVCLLIAAGVWLFVGEQTCAAGDGKIHAAVVKRVAALKSFNVLCVGDGFGFDGQKSAEFSSMLEREIQSRMDGCKVKVTGLFYPGADRAVWASTLDGLLTAQAKPDCVAVLDGALEPVPDTLAGNAGQKGGFHVFYRLKKVFARVLKRRSYWEKWDFRFAPIPDRFWLNGSHGEGDGDTVSEEEQRDRDVADALRGKVVYRLERGKRQGASGEKLWNQVCRGKLETVTEYGDAARRLKDAGYVEKSSQLWEIAFERLDEKSKVFEAALSFYMQDLDHERIKKLITLGTVKGFVGAHGFKLVGDYYAFVRDWPMAKSAYLDAIKLNPGNARLRVAYGVMLRQTKQLEQARKVCLEATQINPQEDWSFIELGNIALESGEVKQALAMFAKAYALKPDYAGTLVDIGKCRLLLGQKQLALEAFDKALNRDDLDVQDMITIADLLKQHGFVFKARGVYERARLKSADNARDQLRYGASVLSRKDAQTDAFFESMLAQNAHSPEVLNLIMNYYYNTRHDVKKAEQVYSKLLELRRKQASLSGFVSFNDHVNLSVAKVVENSVAWEDFGFLMDGLCVALVQAKKYSRALAYMRFRQAVFAAAGGNGQMKFKSAGFYTLAANLVATILPTEEFVDFLVLAQTAMDRMPDCAALPEFGVPEGLFSPSWQWRQTVLRVMLMVGSPLTEKAQSQKREDLSAGVLVQGSTDGVKLGNEEYIFRARFLALKGRYDSAWQILENFFSGAKDRQSAVLGALKMSMDIYDRVLGNMIIEYMHENNIESVQSLCLEGDFYTRWMQWDKACGVYDKAIELTGGDVAVLLEKAVMLRLQGNIDESARLCRKVIKAQDTNVRAYVELGNILFDQEKFSEALDLFLKALEIDEGNVLAQMKAGQCLMLLKDTDRSFYYLERAVASGRLGVNGLWDVLRIFSSRGFERKVQSVKKTLLDKAFADEASAIEFARLALENSIVFDAKEIADRVTGKYPENVKLLLLCAQYCVVQKEYKQAMELYARLKRFVPENAQVKKEYERVASLLGIQMFVPEDDNISPVDSALGKLLEQGRGYLRNNEFGKALQVVKVAQASYPDSLEVLYWLGVCYMRSENHSKADEYFRQVAHSCEPGSKILIRIAFEFFGQSITDRGFDYLRMVWENGGFDIKIIMRLVETAFKEGNLMLVQGLLDGVNTLDSVYAPAYFQKGVLFWKLSKHDQSHELFGHFIELENHTLPAFLKVIRFFRQVNEPEHALDLCRQAFDWYPRSFQLAVEKAFSLDMQGKVKQADKVLLEVMDECQWKADGDVELLGDLFVTRKRDKTALDIFTKGLVRFTQSPGLYARVGKIMFDKGQVSKAMQAYLRAVYFNRKDPEANYMAWRCARLCGYVPADIEPLLQRALVFAGDNPKAASYIGRYLLFSGIDIKTARQMFEIARHKGRFEPENRLNGILLSAAAGDVKGICDGLGINTLKELYCSGVYKHSLVRLYLVLSSLLSETGFIDEARVYIGGINWVDRYFFNAASKRSVDTLVQVVRKHKTVLLVVASPYRTGQNINTMYDGKLPGVVKVCDMQTPFLNLAKEGKSLDLWKNRYGGSFGVPRDETLGIIAENIAKDICSIVKNG